MATDLCSCRVFYLVFQWGPAHCINQFFNNIFPCILQPSCLSHECVAYFCLSEVSSVLVWVDRYLSSLQVRTQDFLACFSRLADQLVALLANRRYVGLEHHSMIVYYYVFKSMHSSYHQRRFVEHKVHVMTLGAFVVSFTGLKAFRRSNISTSSQADSLLR
jgi:hypothetical protein